MTDLSNEKLIRVGSRKSELALIQTNHVVALLQELFPEKVFEIHTMSTIGDRVLNVSLQKIGEKSLFTRDLEDALRRGSIDFAVHSLKDLPTALPPGMAIGAILEREDPRDALVLNEKHKGKTMLTLPKGSVIGTSSLRRAAQLRRKYANLEIVDIRGNLNTRLAKLDAAGSKFAGIILAQAGLMRMGWTKRISQILEPIDVLYAVGQGALAVECRSNDTKTLSMLNKLVCLETTCRILAERSFLKTLGGGCSAPVAVSTNLNGSLRNNNKDETVKVKIIGAVWSLNGKTEIQDVSECCLIGADDNIEDFEITNHADDDEIESSPPKKLRLSESSEGESAYIKPGNPNVIDEDILFDSKGSGDANLEGEIYLSCPFAHLHERDAKNGNASQMVSECPLKIPIGQDFMGKCPYVDIEQKVEFSAVGKCPVTGKSPLPGKCPVTGKTAVDLQKLNMTKDEVDQLHIVVGDVPSQCPFSNKINANFSVSTSVPEKAVKLIDCDVSEPTLVKVAPKIVDDSDSLFCGMYRHPCYSLELFERCEQIGRQLAESLISRGALEVMQCAQDEIHGKATH